MPHLGHLLLEKGSIGMNRVSSETRNTFGRDPIQDIGENGSTNICVVMRSLGIETRLCQARLEKEAVSALKTR